MVSAGRAARNTAMQPSDALPGSRRDCIFTARRVVAGSRKIEVARVRITEAGRRARSVKGALIDRRGDVSPQYHVRHLPRVRDL
jgi:hypothetical protein